MHEIKTQFAADAHETAFQILKPLLDVTTAPTKSYALDLGECIKAGFLLQKAVERPIVQTSLDALAPGHFDAEKRGRLPIATKALLYVKTRLQSERAQSSRAKVPPKTIFEAKQLYGRLRKLAEYHLDTPEDVKELQDIRKGRGYKNLAYGLTRLSRLLEERKDLVQNDAKHYRQEDLEQAPQLALEILEALTVQKKSIWQDYAKRLFVLFRSSYDEVQQAATFVMRRTSCANDFPKLFATARKVRTKKPPQEGAEKPLNKPENKKETRNDSKESRTRPAASNNKPSARAGGRGTASAPFTSTTPPKSRPSNHETSSRCFGLEPAPRVSSRKMSVNTSPGRHSKHRPRRYGRKKATASKGHRLKWGHHIPR